MKTIKIDRHNYRYIENKFVNLFAINNKFKFACIEINNNTATSYFADNDKIKSTLKGLCFFNDIFCQIYPNKVVVTDEKQNALFFFWYVPKEYYFKKLFAEKKLTFAELEENSVNILY